MSSGNNTNSGNNGNSADKIDWQCIAWPNLLEQVEDSLKVQIVKFNEQSHCQHNKLMKQAAEKEAQRKAKEERKKAKEEAKSGQGGSKEVGWRGGPEEGQVSGAVASQVGKEGKGEGQGKGSQQ